ncbi:hypothetical protein [Nocardia sp. CA-119907]|uniref:hypothetical protein n=1 Tax=Nocardia sp. CA-119907 TaxID=3239973 RepID=UPI003D98EBA4
MREAEAMDWQTLGIQLEARSRVYAHRFGIDRTPEWFAMKVAEEAGELMQQFLAATGQGRPRGKTPEQLQDSVDDEIIDVLCQVVLMAHNRGTDIQAVIERKWLRPNESDSDVEPDHDIAAGSADHAIYAQACSQPDGVAGFYNRNVRVATGPASAVNVRIPIPGADTMDHRQWPEPAILTAIAPFVTAAPRLYFESTQPKYQIHEFIDGQPLGRLAPRGHAVPGHVPTDVARLFSQLRAIPPSALPPTAGGLDDDPQRFAQQLWDATRQAYLDHRESFHRLYRQLRVPDDPFEALDGA